MKGKVIGAIVGIILVFCVVDQPAATARAFRLAGRVLVAAGRGFMAFGVDLLPK